MHRLASEHLQSGLCYQKKTCDLKLQQQHFDVSDFVYKLNVVTKKGNGEQERQVREAETPSG